MNKPPAFQFYPKDFLSDEKVVSMSSEQVGWYIILLCYCWLEGSIPSDKNAVAKLLKIDDSSAIAEPLAQVLECFKLSHSEASRLTHKRLDFERSQQEIRRIERSKSGKKGAKSRWNKVVIDHSSANSSAIDPNHSSAIVLPIAKHSSAFASSFASSPSSKKIDLKALSDESQFLDRSGSNSNPRRKAREQRSTKVSIDPKLQKLIDKVSSEKSTKPESS